MGRRAGAPFGKSYRAPSAYLDRYITFFKPKMQMILLLVTNIEVNLILKLMKILMRRRSFLE